MEKFIENLKEAEKIIRTIDHLTYVTFPLVKDKRLLLKILSETKLAVANCINSILQYEYLYKRIKLYKDPKSNFNTFKEKCSKTYGITNEELKLISDLFEIVEMHKKSSMEFVRSEKIVILANNSQPKSISIEKIKEFLRISKSLLQKTKNRILR